MMASAILSDQIPCSRLVVKESEDETTVVEEKKETEIPAAA